MLYYYTWTQYARIYQIYLILRHSTFIEKNLCYVEVYVFVAVTDSYLCFTLLMLLQVLILLCRIYAKYIQALSSDALQTYITRQYIQQKQVDIRYDAAALSIYIDSILKYWIHVTKNRFDTQPYPHRNWHTTSLPQYVKGC